VWGCWGGQGQGLQSESTLCHLSLIKSMGILCWEGGEKEQNATANDGYESSVDQYSFSWCSHK